MQEKLPQVFLHWEDFGRTDAYRNLIKYRDIACSFNDEIQGTSVVTLAAILAALRITKSTLSEQRIVVFGHGAGHPAPAPAGMGVTDTLFRAVSQNGLSEAEARKHFWLIDQTGLLMEYSKDVILIQRLRLRKEQEVEKWEI